jgi:hypothetical protein
MEFSLWINEQWGSIWWTRLRVAARFPDGMNRDDANTMLTAKLKELKDGNQIG